MIDRLFDTPDINLRAKAGHPATDVSIMSIALSVGDTYLFEKLLDADPTLANEPDQYGRVPRAYLEKMLNSKMECIGVSKGTQHQMLKRLDCE